MDSYAIFKYLHSGFRFVVVILVLLAILQSVSGWLGKKPYTNGNRLINLFAMISAHTQLLIGLVLYFISPMVQFSSETMKHPSSRYWTVEHLTIMLIGIVLITIGHSKSKKAVLPEVKHKTIFIFYTLAFAIIALGIYMSHTGWFGVLA